MSYWPLSVPPARVYIGVEIGHEVFCEPTAIESPPIGPVYVLPSCSTFHVMLPSELTVRVPLGITPAQPNVSFSAEFPVALKPAESEQNVALLPLEGNRTISPSASTVNSALNETFG